MSIQQTGACQSCKPNRKNPGELYLSVIQVGQIQAYLHTSNFSSLIEKLQNQN